MAKLSQETIKERIANKQLKIKLLTKARKKIKANYTSGICCALEDSITGSYRSNQWDAADELTSYISKALGNHSFYTTWARSKKESVDALYYNDWRKFGKEAKKARQAWIDWMIKCLQEDIDTLKAKLK